MFFLFEGFNFAYAVALAVFKLYEEEMLEMEEVVLFQFLTGFKSPKKKIVVDADQLIKTAVGLKDRVRKSLKHLEKDYQIHQTAKLEESKQKLT